METYIYGKIIDDYSEMELVSRAPAYHRYYKIYDILFGYVVPFTVLVLAGVFKNMRCFRHKELGAYLGMISVVLLRFVSHFVTGVAIWGQWAPEGMGKFLYSFLYNGGFLSVDFAICIVCAVLMMRSSEIRRLVNMPQHS